MSIRKLLWARFRKLSCFVHKWAGIVSSLVLFVVCLSGTIYVFQDDVIKYLNKDKFSVENISGGEAISIEEAIEISSKATGVAPRSISIPASDRSAWSANVVKDDGNRRGTNYLLNQYEGTVMEQSGLKGQEFFMTVFRLHRWLLLDTSIGRPIVGWATIIMIVILISGLVIWLPRKIKNIYRGLKIKWSGGSFRLAYDLHNVLGFYVAPLVLIMALSGLFWSFDWSRNAIYKTLGLEAASQPGGGGAQQGRTHQGSGLQSRRHDGSGQGLMSQDGAGRGLGQGQRKGQGQGQRNGSGALNIRQRDAFHEENAEGRGEAALVKDYLAYSALLAIADKELDYKGNVILSVPDSSSSTVTITKTKSGFFAGTAKDQIEISRVSGDIVSVNRFSDLPFNQQIASSIKAIHTGEIFGSFSKILYFLACLIATSLPVTGLIMWIKKW